MDKIKVGDKIVYQIHRNDGRTVRSEVSTVMKVGHPDIPKDKSWYLVTHPKLMTPKFGVWVHETNILERL